MRLPLFVLMILATSSAFFTQTPPIEPGVSQELARWRAARYSDVRYKLNLTLEKMSPVLKGTIEVRVNVKSSPPYEGGVDAPAVSGGGRGGSPLVMDWRKIRGHEDKSTISDVSINGKPAVRLVDENHPVAEAATPLLGKEGSLAYREQSEHLIFREGVVAGENVIKLDFTSPILPSGSAITRYVDKEDGSEYIYSLFVPSDASTAFPVFDQPDLKARFTLNVAGPPNNWKIVSNARGEHWSIDGGNPWNDYWGFPETKPISTYVFAFAAGPWERVSTAGRGGGNLSRSEGVSSPPAGRDTLPTGRVSASGAEPSTHIYVRKSQAAKFKPHAAEVFRLNREAVKYFEQYFDYKFPFPKYDLVLIPEFPFGGMEHAGATFLREASVIFPQEPTKNDLVSRATLIFHEAAHQWFGDTVTMRWFDDLWLKEGFATFTAYKALGAIMPEMNAWKVFYERIKQGAYQTDSTRGTTAIYQPIANLSAAKSAYGNIVYNKAPAFLRQAEFYLGEDKFQTAVRAFLKKHEFKNAEWKDLVLEFETSSNKPMQDFAKAWIVQRGLPTIRSKQTKVENRVEIEIKAEDPWKEGRVWGLKTQGLIRDPLIGESSILPKIDFRFTDKTMVGLFKALEYSHGDIDFQFVFPNYGDYGYGIFLLDEKSRDYVLKNIQSEKDPFLRAMMWGALWDSVREGELDPRVFVELVVRVLSPGFSRQTPAALTTPTSQSFGHPSSDKEGSLKRPPEGGTQNEDESTVATLLGRTGTALNYYMSVPPAVAGGDLSAGAKTPPATAGGTDKKAADLRSRVENLLIERMRNAPSLGQRITYYRAFLNVAASEKARTVLKDVLNLKFEIKDLKLKTKDKFDIVTRLLILGDPQGSALLAELEKTETTDDAKRYAYAARAGIGTAENKAKYWNDFVSNKEISESWIEAALPAWNSIRHSELTLGYLERALRELPNHKRNRKIFFVNGWLGAFIGGQRSAEALAIVNKFLTDNPGLDNDLRLKVLENVDLIERAVRIRGKY